MEVGGPREEVPPSLREALGLLFGRPSYRALFVGSCMHFIGSFALLSWSATYLIRVHGLSTTDVGLWFGMVLGGGFALGNILGGYTADLLGRRNLRWYFYMPALADLIALPFFVLFLFPGSWQTALVAFPFFAVFHSSSTNPLQASALALARPSMRALAMAIYSFVTGLVGAGAGPFIAGVLNDLLAPSYGVSAIQISLVSILAATALAGAIALIWGARKFEDDLKFVMSRG